tara:strand:+ start:268 stop:648 length:381 start_codon:yes stop_codon:yes gene_type:complete
MAFPTLTPSSRNFSPGNYQVKTFRAQSGKETRILYGSKRTGMQLALGYKNISDANAELFLDHFDEMKGTYTTFTVTREGAKGGWEGNEDAIGANASGNYYRYAAPPKVTQVKPGISNVQVNLVGVL